MKPTRSAIDTFVWYVVWPTMALLVLAALTALLSWSAALWVLGGAFMWFIVWGILHAVANATGRRRD